MEIIALSVYVQFDDCAAADEHGEEKWCEAATKTEMEGDDNNE